MGSAGVGLALRCCGAPAEWAGEVELFEKTRTEFLQEYKALGTPEIILACSSCYHIFKKYYPEIQIRSLWSLLDDLNIPVHTSTEQMPVIAIHDPCSTRYESEIQDSIRNLVTRLGYRVEELPLNRENTECCSYGGLMWLANPPLAKKVIDRRINESPHAYVTYCVMCRDMFTKQGKQTYHILDLLFSSPGALFGSNVKPPDYSTRHENRSRLKQKLLKELWGESMEETNQFETIQLIISDEMRSIMEERLILMEDVQKVIAHAKKTGMVLYNQRNNHVLTYFCPAYVTYWVEFAKEGNAYKVYNTYSHRMTIEEGIQA